MPYDVEDLDLQQNDVAIPIHIGKNLRFASPNYLKILLKSGGFEKMHTLT